MGDGVPIADPREAWDNQRTEVKDGLRCGTCWSDDWFFDLVDGVAVVHDSRGKDACSDGFHRTPKTAMANDSGSAEGSAQLGSAAETPEEQGERE